MTNKLRLSILIITTLFWSVAFSGESFDSDGDGYDDNSDNCTMVANPSQLDSDGDFNGNMCDADFNNDGTINAADLAFMRSNFFTNHREADLNGDRVVNFADLSLMQGMYFSAPGPTGADPDQPPCTCYFSGDCPSGTFCNYGPGSYTTEDICVWRDIKPNGTVGAGCYIESNLTTGAWVPNICDGVCTSSNSGSTIGLENTNLIAQTVAYWGEAMIYPSAAGGGPVDPELAAQASAMEFTGLNVPIMLGRQTADALAMASGEPFHNYFCHWEGHPDDENPPVVNLAGDTCLIRSGELTVQALVAEIQTPGSAAEIMKGIVDVCPNWQKMFGTQCQPGPSALNCAIQFIQGQAYFLRTPPIAPSAAQDPLDQLLGKALR